VMCASSMAKIFNSSRHPGRYILKISDGSVPPVSKHIIIKMILCDICHDDLTEWCPFKIIHYGKCALEGRQVVQGDEEYMICFHCNK